MKTPIFTGSCTALATPFRGGEVDYAALDELLAIQSAGGTSALVVCGTTGEGSTLSDAEQYDIVGHCVENSRGMKIVAGVGGNNTAKVLEHAQMAEALGADGILMLTPYYNKTSQRGLVEHFSYVADRTALPMIVYNVPSRTGIGIAAETYARLAAHPNINGVKEASGDFTLVSRTLSVCGSELNVWSGNDDNTVAMMAMGAAGVISVASNLLPGQISRLCRLCLAGDFSAAAVLGARLSPLFAALFAEVNPMPLKAAMGMTGLCSADVRLPLCDVSDDTKQRLRLALESVSAL